MKFVEDLKKEVYEEFVENHPKKSHFMQSYYFGNIMKNKHFEPFYVGMEYNGELVATALLLKKKLIGKYCYYYCPRGYVWDFDNYSILEQLSKYLKDYGKKNNALFIKIDPDIPMHDFDKEGNVIENSDKSKKLFKTLKELGYKHKGFSKSFVYEQPRFTFRLDLTRDIEEIYKEIHPTTRKILNKGNQHDLDIYVGNTSDIDDFYETMIETSKREGIKVVPKEYYLNFYKNLNEANKSDLYVVKVKLANLVLSYQTKLEKLNLDLENLKTGDYKNKEKQDNLIHDLEKQIDRANQDLDNIKCINKEEITLSSIMTAKYGNKVWTVHGGNHSLLRELNANYLLYYSIIKDAKDQGYEIIDFFGTSGEYNPSPDNPIFGIHSFKKRLGGEYKEFIGEFDFILNKPLYFAYQKLIPIYRKIRR